MIAGVNSCPAVRTWRDSQNSNVNTGSIAGPYHPNPDSWYGPANQSMVDADIAKAKSIGAQYVRFDFPWVFMEPSAGVYDFARADYIVNALIAAGLTPTPFIGFTPFWINPNATVAPSASQMGSFASAVATHFKGRVKYIEVWNEPDHGHYWNSGWPTFATNALIPAYNAIKAVDPSIKVIFPGLSGGAVTSFWDQAKAAGAMGHFDVMGVHDYTGSVVAPGGAASWLSANGLSGMPIFLGEIGVSSDPAHAGSDAIQATLIKGAFASNATVIQWYDLRDDAIYDPTGTSVMIQPAGYGLFQRGGAPKASASVFSALAGSAPPPPPPPPPPVIVAPRVTLVATPIGTTAPETVTLTGTVTAGTNPIASNSLDFGDGSAPGTALSIAHVYVNAGNYTAKLTATDTTGLTGSASVTITVGGVVPPPPPPPPPVGNLAVSIKGGKFVDASGAVLQLRGVNVSALEFVAAQGWSPGDPWGGVKPNWAAIASWKANCVRIPLNSQSWLGVNGTDPGNNYRQTVQQTVADAHAQGFYVILDLHWTAPTTNKALAQQAMPTKDHDIDFWTSLASTFKNDPGVIFELYNEPFQYGDYYSGDPLTSIYVGGGNIIKFLTGGATYTAACNSPVASMTDMLAAVRATGATNVVLIGGYDWCSAMDKWLAMAPKDPQVGAAWHPYPGQPQSTSFPQDKTSVPAILAAGYPVVATETGDHDVPGTIGSPFVSSLLPWCDNQGISYTPWTWDVWLNPDNVLIKDSAGTPTDGYGQYVKQHFLDMAGGIVPPPPPAPIPPIAAFASSPASPLAGSTVNFDASTSTDMDDAIVAYTWTFGDGTSGSGVRVNHVFVAAGTYTVTLTVTDASGLTSTIGHSTVVAPVVPPPPPPPPPVTEDITVTLTNKAGLKVTGTLTLT